MAETQGLSAESLAEIAKVDLKKWHKLASEKEIAETAKQSAASSKQVTSSVEDLNNLAGGLKQVIERFKVETASRRQADLSI